MGNVAALLEFSGRLYGQKALTNGTSRLPSVRLRPMKRVPVRGVLPTKVNFGSASEAVPGWTNVDKSPAVFLARTPRTRSVMREVHRILAPGGRIRLATPDLAQLIDDYRSGVADETKPAGDVLMSIMHFYQETDQGFVRRMVSKHLSGHWHQWIYDEQSLRRLLLDAGFADVVRGDFRIGEFPDLERVETRPTSLFMEARRA
jgi:hypothetical protein